jgi:hypothetical protein
MRRVGKALRWMSELPEALLPALFVCAIAYAGWQGYNWLAAYLAGAFVIMLVVDVVTDADQRIQQILDEELTDER